MAIMKQSPSTLPTTIRPIGGDYRLLLAGDSAGGQSSGGSGRKSTAGSSGTAPSAATNYTGRFQKLLNGLYETTFASDPISYEQMTGQQLRDQIAEWLRPSYEQAVSDRTLRTGRANAELDADAIARGMGASTFVTDVKSRNLRDEARDVALLESEYGATLAKNVAERLESERARALEVDMFNREQAQADYQMAYDAAALLLGMGGKETGLDTSLLRAKGGKSAATSGSALSSSATKAAASAGTSAENCASFLAALSPSERQNIYSGKDAKSIVYRNEIVASVGVEGFYQLQSLYGA